MEIVKGQAVAILSAYGNRDYSFGWTVSRVTPKSKEVIVEGKTFRGEHWERRFDQWGLEMEKNGSGRYRARLEPDVAKAQADIEDKVKKQAICKAFQEVKIHDRISYHWTRENLLDEVTRLEKALAAVRALAEALPQ